jgi:hypothetical protein
METFKIGVRCYRPECADKEPTLETIRATDQGVSAAEAAETYVDFVYCDHCQHRNRVTLPQKWNPATVTLGGFKILYTIPVEGKKVPVIQGEEP